MKALVLRNIIGFFKIENRRRVTVVFTDSFKSISVLRRLWEELSDIFCEKDIQILWSQPTKGLEDHCFSLVLNESNSEDCETEDS